LAERRRAHRRLSRWERTISAGRGLTFFAGAVCLWLAIRPRAVWFLWLAGVGLVFLGLVLAHDQVIRRKSRLARAMGLYRTGLLRLADEWIGTSDGGDRFLDPHHPYSEDLDLFGEGSLYQRIGAPHTPMGQRTLAEWLCRGAHPAEVRARQAAVADLSPRLDFRERLALLGDDVRVALRPEALARWAGAPPVGFPRGAPLLGAALSALSLAALAAWIGLGWGGDPFLLALLTQSAFALALRRRVQRIVGGIDRPGRDLEVLRGALQQIEDEPFQASRLCQVRSSLDASGVAPSRAIGRLSRLVDLLDSRLNPFFAPIAAVLLWETQIALLLEAWRVDHGEAVPRWLAAVGEVEALSALAGYAFERPQDPFPELVETGPVLEGRGLGHPLLPDRTCVRNDLRLDAELQVLVVSGSNMSGKSTLLRTAGVNVVLARAGAPVRARGMRLSPLTIGASIRTHDSRHDGTSRFYAEITRLRKLMELARDEPPLLFLLDEVLHGTNSSDRRAGAEALVRGFLERGAIGLVTTHDLALAEVARRLAPRAGNVHFEDHLEGGRVAFDYRMREGVVSRSNALALMRAIGLEV